MNLRITLLGFALTMLLTDVLVAQGVSVNGNTVKLSGFADSLGEILNEKQTALRKSAVTTGRSGVGWSSGPPR